MLCNNSCTLALHAATILKSVAQHSAQSQQQPAWAAYRSGVAIARPTTRFTRLALGAQTVLWPGSRAISRSCISSRLVVACKGATSKHRVRAQPGLRVHSIQVHSPVLARTHGCDALPPHPGGIATNEIVAAEPSNAPRLRCAWCRAHRRRREAFCAGATPTSLRRSARWKVSEHFIYLVPAGYASCSFCHVAGCMGVSVCTCAAAWVVAAVRTLHGADVRGFPCTLAGRQLAYDRHPALSFAMESRLSFALAFTPLADFAQAHTRPRATVPLTQLLRWPRQRCCSQAIPWARFPAVRRAHLCTCTACSA